MRCPKCHYISFGSTDRCRNCGYDFSLVDDDAPPELPIRADQPIGPLSDFPLGADSESSGPAPPAPEPLPETTDSAEKSAPLDLPLFSGRSADDAPLVSPPAVPRPPLSVRRGAPTIVKSRESPAALDEGRSGLGGSGREPREREPRLGFASESDRAAESEGGEASDAASLAARAGAGLVDLLILGSIDVGVVYLTLRVLGMPPDAIRLLPPIPLAVFLLLLDVGYLSIFTAAGGQTIGKMLTGVRVVDASGSSGRPAPIALGTAVIRAAVYIASALPACLGFLPILLSADRRALHDRLAGTRVVRA